MLSGLVNMVKKVQFDLGISLLFLKLEHDRRVNHTYIIYKSLVITYWILQKSTVYAHLVEYVFKACNTGIFQLIRH